MSAPLDAAEFIDGYLAEAEEHLSASRASLVAIDAAQKKYGRSPGAVRNLFRSVHTIKGLSAMVGAEAIVDVAHEMETVLRSADQAGGNLPAHAIDVILKGLRAIEERLVSLSRGETLLPAPRDLIEELGSIEIEAPVPRSGSSLSLAPGLLGKLSAGEQEQLLHGLARGRRAVRVDFVPSQARAAEGFNITRVRERMASLGEIVKVIPFTLPAGDESPGKVAFALLVLSDADPVAIAEAAGAAPEELYPIGVLGSEASSRADAAAEEPLVTLERGDRNFVRVEVGRLDDALERLAALVVTRSRLERACSTLVAAAGAQTGGARELTAIIAEQRRQLRDLRAAIMRARMVPVSEVLARAPLLVRGLTRSSNKVVQLSIDAGHSELDKAVADRLFPAVVHLLRNAVDHAIEPAAERRQQGKPEEGKLRVSCAERAGSQLVLEVSDDGRGIDREKVALRARLPVPKDDAELLALVVRPGLSTLDEATHLSGRGLGMDIVKRIVVDQLGGKLALRTTLGQGTTFTLTVPLSVTVLDAFSFVCAERTFVIPVSAVEALAEIEPGKVLSSPNPAARAATLRLFQHRGASVPLFRLSSLLGFASEPPRSAKAILLRREDELLAFEVDRMLGQQEIVVRPLTDPLVTVEGVTGSTDLGDGRPTLVLDPLLLVQRASRVEARAT
ncbi:MAG: chemotaxis protein CheW [Deltaproteobacteria bacterium]